MRFFAIAAFATGLAIGAVAHPANDSAIRSASPSEHAVLPAPDLFGAMLVVR